MSRLLLFALLLSPLAEAHNDVSETIKNLTARLHQKPTAELYYQRATEFRSLREKVHAIEDFRAALQLKPNYRPAKIALIRALGKSDEALEMALNLATGTHSGNSGVEAAFLLAKVHHLRSENQRALAICERLQELARKREPEFHLLHAEILLDLHRPAEAARVLKKSWQSTKSIVLRNNWIDTALTAGQTAEVLPLIEKELATSRFLSSWLIRRARAALILRDQTQAQKDLQAALTELTPRIRKKHPDLTLIADRGLVLALLGQKPEAKKDLALLKNSPLPKSAYRLLTEQLSPTNQTDSK